MQERNTFICGHCFNMHKIKDCIWSIPSKSSFGVVVCPFCEKTNRISVKAIIEAVAK